jgi:hypothetical protein
LTAPSASARFTRSASVTIKEHELDVLNYHPPAEAINRERQIIDDLIEQLRASTYELIRLNREAAASKEAKASKGVLWPRYRCRVHGDSVPFGKSFDRLLVRCEDSKK